MKQPTYRKVEGKVMHGDDFYWLNPCYVDYHDGAGESMCGGLLCEASTDKVIGHADPCGPRGPAGSNGSDSHSQSK